MPVATDPAAESNVCVTDRRRRSRRSTKPTAEPAATETLVKRRKSRATKPAEKNRVDKKPTATKINRLPQADEETGDRRTQDRRRQIDPTTCERDYKPDEIEFMTAMDDYKRRSGRPFPTWSEVLEVLRDLGYRKVAARTQTYSGEE